MHLRFFGAPNDNLICDTMMTFDSIRLHGLLQSLPQAIIALLQDPPAYVTSPMDMEEAERIHLNRAISLAEFLLEIVESVYINPRVRTFDEPESRELLLEAAGALRMLQNAKDARITQIHAELGENFGSATGFQKHNYNDDADRIIAFFRGE